MGGGERFVVRAQPGSDAELTASVLTLMVNQGCRVQTVQFSTIHLTCFLQRGLVELRLRKTLTDYSQSF